MNNQIIHTELVKLHQLAGTPHPDIPAHIVEVWADDLKDIPDDSIRECFTQARRENKKYKIPNQAQVLEAWKGMKAKVTDWRTDEPEWKSTFNQEQHNAIMARYPEFQPYFNQKKYDLYDENDIPDADWIASFNRGIRARFGQVGRAI